MKLALASTVLPARDAPPSITLKIVTMAREGIEVIQANNRRVAAAKKAAALTAKNLQAAKVALEAAQKAVEAAQKDHDEAAEELKDAEESQKAAQKKWEVVDLVQDDEEQAKNCSDSKNRSDVSSDSAANANKKARTDSDITEEITVEGCGIAEVNGTYTRDRDLNNFPRYSKEGLWEGKIVMFEIYRSCQDPIWYIAIIHNPARGRHLFAYFYVNRNKSSVPPSDGWEVYNHRYGNHGVKPPPKIT